MMRDEHFRDEWPTLTMEDAIDGLVYIDDEVTQWIRDRYDQVRAELRAQQRD